MKRLDGRLSNQVRPIKVTYGVYGNADGSVLFELGNTKVLCSVMVQDGVPQFLRGKGQGWLTAEYTMLPAATRARTPREVITMKRNGRSVEISRLIGRSLRAVVDFSKLGERTIYVDCDVLQADGGTRTASISGAYCALYHATQQLQLSKKPFASFLSGSLAAISVGWMNNQALLDINFQEDSSVDADFNFVMTGKGEIIEMQGATEKSPISWNAVEEMQAVAHKGIAEILSIVHGDVSISVSQNVSCISENFSSFTTQPRSVVGSMSAIALAAVDPITSL